jgi:hypothetical protein
MFILIRFLVYTLPFIIFTTFEFLRHYPQYLIYGIIFISVWLLAVAWYLIRHSVKRQSNYMAFSELLNYLVTPLLLVLSTVLFLVFFNNIILYRVVAGFISFATFLFLENVFLYLYYPHKYILSSLENVSGYLNIVVVFFLYSGYFGLNVFLHLESRWLFVGLVFLNALLFLQTLFINKLKLKNTWLALALGVLIFSEFLWVSQFLAFSFLVKGALLALVYYTISGLFRYFFLESLTKKVVYRHLIVILVAGSMLLLTAQWL